MAGSNWERDEAVRVLSELSLDDYQEALATITRLRDERLKDKYEADPCNRPVYNETFPYSCYCSMREADGRIGFLDIETTGLDETYDEVLQVALVTMDDEVLYEGYVRPERHEEWREAMSLNGITPEMVKGKPTLLEEKEAIESALGKVDVVVGWNVTFAIEMLYGCGIDMPCSLHTYCDLEPEFCEAWRIAQKGLYDREWEKRSTAARWLGIQHQPYDALSDARVLIPIWEWVASQQPPRRG